MLKIFGLRWRHENVVGLLLAGASVAGMLAGCKPRQPQQRPADPVRSTIVNPVIRGFNPDPSMIRVGRDYYIAVSSFEWFPGIPLYHSIDLANWSLAGHGITKTSQADLRGVPPSGGIYAPKLAYHQGVYYLLYTTVMTSSDTWPVTATPNYIIKARDIRGPWSDPVYLHSAGFDPSLFFDEDNKAYVLSMVMDFRAGEPTMGKILMQEYDTRQEKLTGAPAVIFDERNVWGTEGPNLFRHGGYYYLMVAQGGTFYDHQASLARSKNLWGPYESSPYNPLITAKNDSSLRLQRAGHATLVQTHDDRWYISYLAARPLMPARKSPLGRETCIQEVEWTHDGWLQLAGGGNAPRDSVQGPLAIPSNLQKTGSRDDFDTKTLGPEYAFLREPPHESWLSLTEKPGHLMLRGRKPFTSNYEQSLIARRLDSYTARAETELLFDPDTYRQMAGLICYYDNRHFYYFNLTYDERRAAEILSLKQMVDGRYKDYEIAQLSAGQAAQPVALRFSVVQDSISWSYRVAGQDWKAVPQKQYLGHLADEQKGKSGFTGSMIGLCVQDLLYERKKAYFDYFHYESND